MKKKPQGGGAGALHACRTVRSACSDLPWCTGARFISLHLVTEQHWYNNVAQHFGELTDKIGLLRALLHPRAISPDGGHVATPADADGPRSGLASRADPSPASLCAGHLHRGQWMQP